MGRDSQKDNDVEAVDVKQGEKYADNFKCKKNNHVDENESCHYTAGSIFMF